MMWFNRALAKVFRVKLVTTMIGGLQKDHKVHNPIRSDLIEANSSDTDYDANVRAMEILVSQENP